MVLPRPPIILRQPQSQHCHSDDLGECDTHIESSLPGLIDELSKSRRYVKIKKYINRNKVEVIFLPRHWIVCFIDTNTIIHSNILSVLIAYLSNCLPLLLYL